MEEHMSKFIDSLKKMSEGTLQPMGFGRARTEAARPRMRLVALLEGAAAAVAADAYASADAAIVPVKDMESAKSLITGLSGKTSAPVGINVPDSVKAEQIDGFLAAAGTDTVVDFLVFRLGAPVNGLAETKLGKILEVDLDISDSFLRALNSLAVDAVMIRQAGAGLTWQDLMAIQRVAAATSKPVILAVQSGIGKAELQALWNAGIDAVVVTSSGAGADEVKRVMEIIKELKFPSPPSEHSVALVPRVSPEPEQHEDHGDEEEDDDD
jgi:hypothetical protein